MKNWTNDNEKMIKWKNDKMKDDEMKDDEMKKW